MPFEHRKRSNQLVPNIAIQKAEEYNKLYNGVFIRAMPVISLPHLVDSIQRGSNNEVSVSSVRTNRTYGAGYNCIIVGYGTFTQLYDSDVSSLDYRTGFAKGKLRAAAGFGAKYLYTDKPQLHANNVHTIDEGFMPINSMKIVIVGVTKSNIIKYPLQDSTNNALIKLKQLFPHVKVLPYDRLLNEIKQGGILELVYKAKQEQDAEEIRSGELGMYD